jgi:hypothetical protein
MALADRACQRGQGLAAPSPMIRSLYAPRTIKAPPLIDACPLVLGQRVFILDLLPAATDLVARRYFYLPLSLSSGFGRLSTQQQSWRASTTKVPTRRIVTVGSRYQRSAADRLARIPTSSARFGRISRSTAKSSGLPLPSHLRFFSTDTTMLSLEPWRPCRFFSTLALARARHVLC